MVICSKILQLLYQILTNKMLQNNVMELLYSMKYCAENSYPFNILNFYKKTTFLEIMEVSEL